MSTNTNTVYLPSAHPGARSMPPRIPQAAHRHAAPSGPWPWADIVEPEPAGSFFLPNWGEKSDGDSDTPTLNISPSAKLWREYPSLLFPNWTQSRLERSAIAKVIRKKHEEGNPCIVYRIDVNKDGRFMTDSDCEEVKVTPDKYDDFWMGLRDEEADKHRVRVFLVENMTGPVMQMLGAMHKIEPFFFSSSLNWIPSRYQEDVKKGRGDHITLTLTFLRVMPNPMTAPNTPASPNEFFTQMVVKGGSATIDTQAPLVLRSSDRILLIDQLAFHMVRRKEGSTIISYHPTPEWKTTSARYLHSRVRFVGESIYWQSIFRRASDPTFVLLSMLWYALYAWDEALESLYLHISWMESRVLVTNDIQLTRELHIIRASLLHYTSLLENFRKAILFVRNTPNPATQQPGPTSEANKSAESDTRVPNPRHDNQEDQKPRRESINFPTRAATRSDSNKTREQEEDLEESKALLERECDTLVTEIERLEMYRRMQEMRLDNIMNLAFSSVSFEDSRVMKRMAEQSLRDGTAMKQIAYLTMIFLPASFVSAIFGMNVKKFADDGNATVPQYLAVALPLTAVSIWVIMALHGTSSRFDTVDSHDDSTFVARLWWPWQLLKEFLGRMKRKLRSGKRMHVGIV